MHCWTTVCSQVVLIASERPLQPVADRDEHVLDAPVLYLGEHLQPEPRTLLTITGPDTEDVACSVHGDAHHNVERGVSHLPVTDLHDDRVDEDHGVKRIQWPARPFGEFRADLLGDLADRVLEDLRPIDLVEMRDDLTRGQPVTLLVVAGE